MSDIGFADLSVRLAKTLLLYSGAMDDPVKKPKTSLTQKELADMIGVEREGVNRQISKWRRQGIVSRKRGWLFIEKPGALAELSIESGGVGPRSGM
jgi:CRP-like cAMP-binding protein